MKFVATVLFHVFCTAAYCKANGNSTSMRQLTGKRSLGKNEELKNVIVHILDGNNLPTKIGIYIPNNKIILYRKEAPTLQDMMVRFLELRITGKARDNLMSHTSIRVMNFHQNEGHNYNIDQIPHAPIFEIDNISENGEIKPNEPFKLTVVRWIQGRISMKSLTKSLKLDSGFISSTEIEGSKKGDFIFADQYLLGILNMVNSKFASYVPAISFSDLP